MVATVAAILFAIVTAGAAGFQLALAFGAPWGAYAMGGAFQGKYPPLMRLAAVAQAGLLVLIALIVLSRAGLVLKQWEDVSSWLVWVVVAFSAVGSVLNTLTPSASERRIWAPITIVMLICSLAVALSAEK
jgi:hypothetical protein